MQCKWADNFSWKMRVCCRASAALALFRCRASAALAWVLDVVFLLVRLDLLLIFG
jgi:hypothetical protein